MSNATPTHNYYLPEPAAYPIIGSFGLLFLMGGMAMWFNDYAAGPWSCLLGLVILIIMMKLWFGKVIGESEGGLYTKRVDISFRWSMSWFIFSEVMFFAAFFGALFYSRLYTIPSMGDLDQKLLWPDFVAVWPSAGPAAVGELVKVNAFGIPALNTLLLLSSGATVTVAHHGLLANNRGRLILWLGLTILLGITFLGCQAYEYQHAYSEGLKLDTGIFGTTFYMLTGFHGFHVTVGTIMLIVIWFRCLKGHFKPDHHFAFEGVAWYWHFVDVVWLFLFVFVYWL
ncbi:MAG TPA: cytochrome c oxidase subunit 3 [Burkholderiales bacterium]|nr:cytochrome c oxidase subunit 3 [Burkholderiales bacterium]